MRKKEHFLNVLVFVCALHVPLFSKEAKNNKIFKKRNQSTLEAQGYRAKVDGIECKLCAELALDLIKNVDGVVRVFFLVQRNDYEAGELCFVWDASKGPMPQEHIKNILQHEEFVMVSCVSDDTLIV